jgi:hypothetical protein
MDFPLEAVRIKYQVDALRQTVNDDGIRHGKGWSRDKNFLHKGQVPVTLHQRMAREIDKAWLWNPEIRDRFFHFFRIGCVNKSDLSKR